MTELHPITALGADMVAAAKRVAGQFAAGALE